MEIIQNIKLQISLQLHVVVTQERLAKTSIAQEIHVLFLLNQGNGPEGPANIARQVIQYHLVNMTIPKLLEVNGPGLINELVEIHRIIHTLEMIVQ